MAIMACCACSSLALLPSSTVICPKPFSSSFSLVHPPSVASSSHLPPTPPHKYRRKSAITIAAPSILSSRRRHRHLAASAGRPPPESTGSSSDDDDEEKSSISSFSSTSSGILVTFIRIRDLLSIFFAVLFWICLFFWASVFDGNDGGKPNKRPWFKR